MAKNADGPAITGPVIERFINMPAGASTLAINTAAYFALALSEAGDAGHFEGEFDSTGCAGQRACADTVWQYAVSWGAGCGEDLPEEWIRRTWAYELVFTAKDPLVPGIGFAATRDLNSFLRYGDADSAGNVNPVAKRIKWAVSRGNSQSGDFVRSFINLGFNQDESRRIVWDGVNPHIAARQLALNIRFGNPGAAAGPSEPGSEGVLWWSDYADTARHRPAAEEPDRCRASNMCPKIIETFGIFGWLRKCGATSFREHGTAVAAAPARCLLPANPNPETETIKAPIVPLWIGSAVPDGLVHAVLDHDFGPEIWSKDLSGVISNEPPNVRQVLPVMVPRVDSDGTDVGGVPSVLRQAPLGSYPGCGDEGAWRRRQFRRGFCCGRMRMR